MDTLPLQTSSAWGRRRTSLREQRSRSCPRASGCQLRAERVCPLGLSRLALAAAAAQGQPLRRSSRRTPPSRRPIAIPAQWPDGRRGHPAAAGRGAGGTPAGVDGAAGAGHHDAELHRALSRSALPFCTAHHPARGARSRKSTELQSYLRLSAASGTCRPGLVGAVLSIWKEPAALLSRARAIKTTVPTMVEVRSARDRAGRDPATEKIASEKMERNRDRGGGSCI